MSDAQWIDRVLDSVRWLILQDAPARVVVGRVERALRDCVIDPETPSDKLNIISTRLACRLERERCALLEAAAVNALGAPHVLLARALAYEAARDTARQAFSEMAAAPA